MTKHAPTTTVAEIQAELAALEDPKIRAVNERHGDEHGVNLTKLRAIATRLKTQHELALELWATGDAATRLVALLVCRPKAFSAAELDTMMREAELEELEKQWRAQNDAIMREFPRIDDAGAGTPPIVPAPLNDDKLPENPDHAAAATRPETHDVPPRDGPLP